MAHAESIEAAVRRSRDALRKLRNCGLVRLVGGAQVRVVWNLTFSP